MKYKGQEVKGKNREIIPILRPGGDIIFIAEAIQDWIRFNELVPAPEAPIVLKPGNVKVANPRDKNFQKALVEYNELKTSYFVIASLRATPELEWETVDFEAPSTWGNYRKELEAADFTEIEMSQIVMGVRRANSLDENMIDEARANFLHGMQGSEN